MGSTSVLSYQLTDTIDLPGTSILELTHVDENLVILNNSSTANDTVDIFDLSGNPISSYSTPTRFNSGITYNGIDIIFGNGGGATSNYLREMDPTTGTYSGPLTYLGSVMGLGFDGTNIYATAWATMTGSELGVLTIPITIIDGASYNIVGSTSVTIDTGTEINSTPTYSVSWHNNNLYIAVQGVNQVYQFDASYSLIGQIPIITSNPHGTTFIGDDLYVADRGAGQVYRYSPVPIPPRSLAFRLRPAGTDRNSKTQESSLTILLSSYGDLRQFVGRRFCLVLNVRSCVIVHFEAFFPQH
jgi:hypothetical protein